MRPPLALLLPLVLPGAASAGPELVPRVGIDFDHFGETYRVTEDRDTVATINDYGTVVGLTLRMPGAVRDRYRLDTDVHLGRQTRRLRLDFEGRVERGANAFEVEHEGAFRVFAEDGDYSVSSNYLDESARISWERRFGEDLRLRLRESLDVTWYQDPDPYNLSTRVHRPGADLRWSFGDLNEVRLGYRLGRRDVPDSSSLDYWRHTVDADVSFLIGWTTALDVTTQLDRRVFEPGSVRESSWEFRGDLNLEFGSVDRITYRLLQESELVRYEQPDDYVDFDFSRARTGFQVEVHRGLGLDLSVMPSYSFLTSMSAPQEEYTEAAVELGVDWRVGRGTWISVSDEVGHRDYEIDAVPIDPANLDLTADQLLADAAYSDYVLNRLTVLVTSDVTRGFSVNLFANWQPEDHRVNLHDTDTRIVSGGVEYRF